MSGFMVAEPKPGTEDENLIGMGGNCNPLELALNFALALTVTKNRDGCVTVVGMSRAAYCSEKLSPPLICMIETLI